MTRMVDEQRTQAGVLKALGYSNGAILSQYFLYAGIASVLGCVLGIAAGSYFLPKMIWHAYNIMYGFTSILYAFDWPLALVSSGCISAVRARHNVVRRTRRTAEAGSGADPPQSAEGGQAPFCLNASR